MPAVTPSAGAPERVPAPALRWGVFALIVLAFVALAFGDAARTKPWINPDEPAHFLYVEHVATTGTLPVLHPGDWQPERMDDLIDRHFPADEPIDFLHYESWQPPLYYLVSAPVFRLAPAGDRLAQLWLLRRFNVLFGVVTLWTGYLVARTVLRGLARSAGEAEWLALAAPAAVAGIPMFTSQSAALNNDNLAVALAGLLTWLAVRLPGSSPGSRLPLLYGFVLGLAVLSKLTNGMFLGIGLAALSLRDLYQPSGFHRFLRHAVLLGVAMLLVMSPWLVRQGLTYGWDDLLAKRLHDAVLVGRAFPSYGVDYLLAWATRVFESAWGTFGSMQFPLPRPLLQLYSALCQAGLVGFAIALTRTWRAGRGALFARVSRPELARPLLLLLVLVGAWVVLLYYNVTSDLQAQGRFLYDALPATATLMILGWATLLPTRWRVEGVGLLVLGLVALNAFVVIRLLPSLLPH